MPNYNDRNNNRTMNQSDRNSQNSDRYQEFNARQQGGQASRPRYNEDRYGSKEAANEYSQFSERGRQPQQQWHDSPDYGSTYGGYDAHAMSPARGTSSRNRDSYDSNMDAAADATYGSFGGSQGGYGSGSRNDYRTSSRNMGRDDARYMNTNGSTASERTNDYGLGIGDNMGQFRNAYWNNYRSEDSNERTMSHRGRGPKGYKRSDDRIKEEVCETLSHHHDIDATELEVEVKEGIVTLKGHVENRMQKRMAEDCVEHLNGVTDVKNELAINQSLFERAKEYFTGHPSEQSKTEKTKPANPRH